MSITLSNRRLLPVRRDGQIQVSSSEALAKSNSTAPSGGGGGYVPPGTYASIIHALVDPVHHPVIDLTPGHVLTALADDEYGFAPIPDDYLFNDGDTASGEYIFSGNIKIDALESNDVAFMPGFLGTGWKLQEIDNKYYLETDYLTIRKKFSVFDFEAQKISFVGGQQVISPGGGITANSDLLWDSTEGLWYFETEANANMLAADDIIVSEQSSGYNTHYNAFVVDSVVNGKTYLSNNYTTSPLLLDFAGEAWNQVGATLTQSESVGTYTVTAEDNYISKSVTSFSGAVYNKVAIRYKFVTADYYPSQSVLFYGINGGHSFHDSYYQRFTLNPDGDWHTIVIDMSNLHQGGNDWITHNINALRFDVENNATGLGDVILIDYIIVTEGIINNEFVQMGNISNAERQNLIINKAYGSGNPKTEILQGVNSLTITPSMQKVVLGQLEGVVYSDTITLTEQMGLYTNNLWIGGGIAGNWTINDSAIFKNIGSGGAGMSPSDFPFYAGQTYANRAIAPFRITPDGVVIVTETSMSQLKIDPADSSLKVYGAGGYLTQIGSRIVGPYFSGAFTDNCGSIVMVHRNDSGVIDQRMNLLAYTQVFYGADSYPIFSIHPYSTEIIKIHSGNEYYPFVSAFGSGLDGDVTITENTTLSGDREFNNLIINTGCILRTAGYTIKVRCKLWIKGSGQICGNSGGQAVPYSHRLHSAAATGTGGAGGSGSTPPGSTVKAGGSGGSLIQNNSTSVPYNLWVGAGGGGGGSVGAASSTVGTAGGSVQWGSNGGAGGNGLYVSGTASLSGGHGGSGGGYVEVWAHTINIEGANGINANGVAGGNGSTSGSNKSGNGGGGGAGAAILFYHVETGSGRNGAPDAKGGAAGTGGNGGSAGGNGPEIACQI